MSTSESEMNMWDDDLSSMIAQEQDLPDDFSEEEMEFAQELGGLFAPEQEELPPYFVQTLLEPDEARFQPVESGFERKTSARVFRRLKLKRRLFQPYRPSLQSFVTPIVSHRPVMALLAACLLFMVFSMVTTGPSFASGLSLLFAGAHSGVMQVMRYPNNITAHYNQAKANHSIPQPEQLNLFQAQRQLHFPLYWPTVMPENYALSSAYLYRQSPNEEWADGPLFELDYSYALPGTTPHGTGQISIFEFKPLGKVYQVVQSGAAHVIQIDAKQPSQAIYVDGQWVRLSKFGHAWIYGGRGELIYEHDGVIFWIVGDQHDGMDSKALLNIATSLQTFQLKPFMRAEMGNHLRVSIVNEPNDDTSWLFSGDVVYSDSPYGSFFGVIGADPSVPVQQHAKGGMQPSH